ncbi:DNA/RNA non-specific endonuclease [Pseudomonas sp. EL_65y_Pfl2_R96]|uniref:DNA/RNA non-specific endonuclease n=1 Tax=Pseudomonas sp. EL_65y_Pfl2_R96 TaxID=3088699 RepID=UPI0030DA6570
MSDEDVELVASTWAGIQGVVLTPKPASYFEGRTGYARDFLGAPLIVELPTIVDADRLADVVPLEDQTFELKYQHFSTVQSKSRRLPIYSACNINGAESKNIPRHSVWSYDGRIDKQYQILKEAYGKEEDKRFSRGHMTRRQDPNWGTFEIAQRANIDTFFVTNACPQWQPFNDGLWGDLEDYILANAKGDEKKISVFTGPFFQNDDPVRFDVKIPTDFWKVVAFISEQSGKLTAIAYVMSQRKYLDTGIARDLDDFQTSQVPLLAIETKTGLSFTSLQGKDVFGDASLEFVQPIRRLADTHLGG